MWTSKFTEEQIVRLLREAEKGEEKLETLRDICRGKPTKGAMGPSLIAVISPGFCDLSSLFQTRKPMFIQAFVSKTPIEALADSILHGLSRLDEHSAGYPAAGTTG